MTQQVDTWPASKHFTLQELADGVYAAVAMHGGMAYSNAGIVDLGEQTLVFDTFQTPQAAADLRAAAEQLTGRPVSYVVISHQHADHWCGNQAFDGHTPILATRTTGAQMLASSEWLRELQEDPAGMEQMIQEDLERLQTESDERWRATIQSNVDRWRFLKEVLPTIRFRFADLTFDGPLTLHGSRRRAELRAVTPGHTVDDLYLLLPQERILFMGDLGFFQCQPYMAFCDAAAWQEWLAETEQSDVETYVPGHGPLGTRADLVQQRQYLAFVTDMVSQAVQAGLSLAETLAQALPAPWDAWLHGGMGRWETNVQTLYQRLAGDEEVA